MTKSNRLSSIGIFTTLARQGRLNPHASIFMKISSTALKTFASVLGTGLLAACGGGGAANSSADATPASVAGAHIETASVDVGGVVSASKRTSDLMSRSGPLVAPSTTIGMEASATADDLSAIASALRGVGDVFKATDLSSQSMAASSDPVAGLSLDTHTVGRLSVSSAATVPGQFVRLSQEGHSFVMPAISLVRYGDPATNRWVSKYASGDGQCNNLYFRNDPASGTAKLCQVWGTTADAIAMGTGPVWSTPAGAMPVIDVSQIPTPWIGFTALRVQDTDELAPSSDIGQFRTVCGVSKLSFDDPIVFPGQVGKSHLHTFFGNTGVGANSTPESLRTTGSSTCRGGIANRSAYWVPTMIDTRTGTPVIPTGNGVYYKTGYDLPTSVIQPIPAGLRMIAGSAGATAPGSAGYRFKCIGGPNNENDKYGTEIPNCDTGASLWQEIFFPQCWDGVNLDSPDHKSHMAYPSGFKCPADHPVAIPAIAFNVEYVVVNQDDPLHWRLSSDNYDTRLPGGYSSHGDWFNGWQSDISNAWAKGCVQAVKDCHSHLLGDGRMMY